MQKYQAWEPPFIENRVARNILLTLGITIGVGFLLLSPLGLHFLVKGAVQAILRKKGVNRELQRLKSRGYVSLTKTKTGIWIRLLKKGRQHIERIKFEELKFPRSKIWDNKWRLYFFDIPEKHRLSRDLLRKKLKNLGMYNIQRSVFVYPHDCRKELEFISDHYAISEYSSFAEIVNSDIDAELRMFFKRKKLI